MRVVVPCDAVETRKAAVAAAKTDGPAYLRFAREASPVFTTAKTPFKIGRAETFRFGGDVTIVAAGPVLYEALLAAETLSARGIEARVVNMHTVKPLDHKALVAAAKATGAVVTAEEAQAAGGLGGAVCEALASYAPVPVERVGIPDRFGESGEPSELMEGFGLTAPFIALAAERAVRRKRGEPVADRPEHVSAAERRLAEMAQRSLREALARSPRKWGGTKPDASLKSRSKKSA
jgi:transketolase